jgi:methionyl-tRNA formyltransferase
MRIGVLCNNKLAMPVVSYLMGEGILCGLATADRDMEVVQGFSTLAKQGGVGYCKISYRDFAGQLQQWMADTRPDAVFVVTFPWRIPAGVLALPRWGFVNFHYGLLPEMRGADPIFESIRKRKAVAGATVHIMDAGLDTGPVLYREEFPLQPELTYGMVSSQVAMMGERMCRNLVGELRKGALPAATAQDESKAVYLPKVGEEEITIKWGSMEAADIIALVRSCNPIARYGTPTAINGWKIGVCDVSEVNLQGDASAIAPGTILAIDPQNGLVICCKNGKAVKLEVVYTAEGYLPGYKLGFFGIQGGMVFG